MKKTIPNYENYWINEQGEVFNETSQRWLQGSIGEHGYKYYRLSKNNKKKMFYAHRLVAEAYIDNPLNLPVVNHIDGNKLNNSIDNLEWASYSDNTKEWHNKQHNVFHKPLQYYQQDLPGEEWRAYGNYLVSSCGRVRHAVKNNLLRPSVACGYYKVRLSNNGLVEDCLIHKLVWQLFSNQTMPTKEEVIDHIDGNKLNNTISNLRKITLSDNVNAALYETKTNATAKRVAQYSLLGEFIQDFPSAAAAARALELDPSTITKVCRGQNKTHGGFKFKYI